MIVDRYYYNQLNNSEKDIYKALYNGLRGHEEQIHVPGKLCLNRDMLHKIFCAVMDDNPLIYYVNQSSINMAQDMFGNVAICPQYFFSAEKIADYNQKVQDAVNLLISRLKLTECSDYEKELRIHDYLCRNVVYDYAGTDLDDIGRVIASHNIFGVLAHKRAQCEGIAKTIKVLLNAVDVKCIVLTGKAKEHNGQWSEHAWNMVSLEGVPYLVDATWDIGSTVEGFISYDYFNVTDAQTKDSHVPYGELPVCKAEAMNFFKKNGRQFTTKAALKSYVEKSITQGNKMLYFHLHGNWKVVKVADEIEEFAGKLYMKKHDCVKISRTVNEQMNTCRIILQ